MAREVAFVKRFKLESMYGLSTRTKKVTVVERWPLVEVRLYENRVQERAPLQNTYCTKHVQNRVTNLELLFNLHVNLRGIKCSIRRSLIPRKGCHLKMQC